MQERFWLVARRLLGGCGFWLVARMSLGGCLDLVLWVVYWMFWVVATMLLAGC